MVCCLVISEGLTWRLTRGSTCVGSFRPREEVKWENGSIMGRWSISWMAEDGGMSNCSGISLILCNSRSWSASSLSRILILASFVSRMAASAVWVAVAAAGWPELAAAAIRVVCSSWLWRARTVSVAVFRSWDGTRHQVYSPFSSFLVLCILDRGQRHALFWTLFWTGWQTIVDGKVAPHYKMVQMAVNKIF